MGPLHHGHPRASWVAVVEHPGRSRAYLVSSSIPAIPAHPALGADMDMFAELSMGDVSARSLAFLQEDR